MSSVTLCVEVDEKKINFWLDEDVKSATKTGSDTSEGVMVELMHTLQGLDLAAHKTEKFNMNNRPSLM